MRLVPKIWGLCGTFVAPVQTVSKIGNMNLNLSTTQINVPRSDRTFYLLMQIRSIMMVRVTRVNWSQSQVLLLCLKIIIRKEKESQRGTSCRFVRCRGQGQASAQGESAQAAHATSMEKQGGAAREKSRYATPIWWSKSGPVESRKRRNNKIGRLLRWTMAARSTLGESTQKYLLNRKKEYLILEGDRAGANAVMADQYDTEWELKEKRHWGVWAEAAEQVSAYWQAQEHSTMSHYLQAR